MQLDLIFMFCGMRSEVNVIDRPEKSVQSTQEILHKGSVSEYNLERG